MTKATPGHRASSTATNDGPVGAAQSRWWFVGSAATVTILGLFSNRVGPADLDSRTASDLRGLLGAITALSVMTLGLQLVLVGLFSDLLRSSEGTMRVRLPRRSAPIAAVAIVTGGLAALGATAFIDASSAFEAAAAATVGIAVTGMIGSLASRSVLLGGERWRDLAVISLVAATARLLVTLAVQIDHPVGAVFAGLAVGETVGAVGAILFARHAPRSDMARFTRSRHLVVGGAAAAGLAAVVGLSSLTVHRLLGAESLVFNESAAIARLVFVLIFTVAFVFFPAMARYPVGSVGLRTNFHSALLLATGSGVVAGAAIIAFPTTFLELVGATPPVQSAADSVTVIRLLTLAFVGFGIAGVSLMQYIAHGSRLALWTLPLAIGMVIGQLAADRATTLAWLSLATAIVLVVVVSLPALARVRPVLRPELVRQAPDDSVAEGTITVVIPSYNPGPTVLETIEAVLRTFADTETTVDVIVVSDGSTDGSIALIDALDHPSVRHIVHQANRGKGAALRTGFAAANSSQICFIDADGDIDPRTLLEMARIQTETEADIVFGSKKHDESTVSVPLLRRVSSWSFASLIRVLFHMDIVDTQTGIKLYSAEVIDQTLPVLEEEGFALDLELFVAARGAGFRHFVEVPVELVRKGGSTVSLWTVLEMLARTLRIFWRSEVTLHYLRASHSAQPVVEHGARGTGSAVRSG